MEFGGSGVILIMNSKKIWLHGTAKYFDQWEFSSRTLPHKNGIQSHSAIFFTTNKGYALGASDGTNGLCSAELLDGANVIDMNNCSTADSERYRLQVAKKRLGHKNPQIIYAPNWHRGWKSGSIMKYAVSNEAEARIMLQKADLAKAKHTPVGAAVFNELQLLTRNAIEELVTSAREIGYDAVIGCEIDTLHSAGQQTYEIMFVVNRNILTNPNWVNKPNLSL